MGIAKPLDNIARGKLPYALIVAQRLRKQAKTMIMEAEALESHYGHDVRPMRDNIFRHSRKFKKTEMMIKDKK